MNVFQQNEAMRAALDKIYHLRQIDWEPTSVCGIINQCIMAEQMKLFRSAHDEACIELTKRAEKAEADYKIVCDKNDILRKYCEAAQAAEEKWQGNAEKAEARVKELEAGRQSMQAEGKHPAPCARDCEANAFQIEVRRLQAVELNMYRKLAAEKLRADQGWARYEAANRAKNDLERERGHKQSIIDRLMLEYCPDEMTAGQVTEWASHQKRAE